MASQLAMNPCTGQYGHAAQAFLSLRLSKACAIRSRRREKGCFGAEGQCYLQHIDVGQQPGQYSRCSVCRYMASASVNLPCW